MFHPLGRARQRLRRISRTSVVARIAVVAVLGISVGADSASALTSSWNSGGNIGPGIRVYSPAGYHSWRQSHAIIPNVSPHVDAVCTKGVTVDGTIRNGNSPCTLSDPLYRLYAVACLNQYPSGAAHRAYVYWTGTLSRPISGSASTVPF